MNFPRVGLPRLAFPAAFALVAFVAGAGAAGPQPTLELTADNLAGVIDPLMGEWIDKHHGPGAVVVVVTRDGPVFAKGYGLSDVEAKKPFTADTTLVRPGSISKLFTGIAVMQLVDQGRLDLDRDVNGYLDFAIPTPQGGVPVTLRRLLTHRAGFEEHAKDLFSRDGEPQPLGPWLAKSLPQRLFPNGDVEAYSNYGFGLAGYIVERVSGESYASYIQRHILDPLGMRHSTFQQPLPDDLKPLMAKGYRRSDQPPLAFFNTITPAPAGALSSTGEDMGRFVRALINGGELDGARILPKARLDEMMTPANATAAGYLGLVFFGTKIAGHETVGHNGITMTFFSDLRIFAEQGMGVFVSRDGVGEVKNATELPHPATAIARRFLPKVTDGEGARAASFPSEAKVAGIYQSSRRNESSFVRISALLAQIVVKVDGEGHVRGFSAIWPFGDGTQWRRVERDLYQGSTGRLAFVDDGSSGSVLATPALRLQRVPWSLDVRWIAPAFFASVVMVFVSLLAWPFAALWRHLRKKPWSADSGEQRNFRVVRLVMLVDAAVIVALAVLFVKSSDNTIFNDALDPWLLALYAIAWLGVLGAALTLWAVAGFWRRGIGGRWSRVHHALIAASSVIFAWFFLTFHVAGTTLNY